MISQCKEEIGLDIEMYRVPPLAIDDFPEVIMCKSEFEVCLFVKNTDKNIFENFCYIMDDGVSNISQFPVSLYSYCKLKQLTT